MTAIKGKCPECQLVFDLPPGASGSVSCPICDTMVPVAGKVAARVPVAAVAPGNGRASTPAASGRVAVLSAAPMPPAPVAMPAPPLSRATTIEAEPSPDPAAARRKAAFLFLGGLAAFAFIGVVCGVILLVVVLMAPKGSTDDGSRASRSSGGDGGSGGGSGGGGGSGSGLNAKPPLPAKLQAEVNAAIDKGKDYLYGRVKSRTVPNSHQGGEIALCGLTLLECGVPPDDDVIKQVAEDVRSSNRDSTYTYGMALAILFLDRLGDARDEALIRRLALRLVGGQLDSGRWTYNCNVNFTPTDEDRLHEYLKDNDYDADVLAGNGNKLNKKIDDLPPNLKNLHIVNLIQNGVRGKKLVGGGDNSNTQFALLGLWVAKRHGVPVQPSLAFVERQFRDSQNGDGSWGYGGNTERKWSMTCAGLLGLAVGRGARKDDAESDKVLESGLRFLASTVDQPRKNPAGWGGIIGADSIGDLYYFWSLERVAMIYDLPQIGGKDWYRWAAEKLVGAQKPDGSWQEDWQGLKGFYDPGVTTSFALLVLKRANVAQDLTKNLKKLVRVKDLDQPKD